MKKINIYLKSCLAALLLMACSAEEPAELDPSLDVTDPVVVNPIMDGTMTANIDGTDFMELDEIKARLTNDGSTGDKIVISGKKGSEVITLKMPLSIAPNNVNTPYPLGNATTNYEAIYNTSNVDSYSAAESGGMHVTFDESLWVANVAQANVNNGVTTINGYRGNNGESFNILLNAVAVNSYQFGPVAPGSSVNNTANYTVSNGGGNVYANSNNEANGNIAITKFDADNKLISGTFNFDGLHYFTSNPTTPTGPDTDGDGIVDSVETENGTDPNNPCSPLQPAGYTGHDANNAIWMAADCNNDGQNNGDEITAGTDPYEGNVDTDGDGVSDTQETLDGTDINDPCSPAQSAGYTGYNATIPAWQNADCDGDGTSNLNEINGPDGDPATTADNTDPYFVEYEQKSFTSGSFTNITYTGNGNVTWGLNISLHDEVNKRIVGTYRFITASIGQDPVVSHVITNGTFDVTYE
ncbi:DUF6252 family protein [Pseudofulvibacter geojedonensis]|uniref:DUF6252 family protein n=1 Tax=Pseudofulvibacter geojedonensis TaxID=1123758 RepID=A0ABW3HY63_9FLAO